MEDNISKIKDKLDVVEIISGYLKVQKAGMNFRARCPFHNEKTPSFYISPERQIWHCFGCSAGGDMFGFVKQIEGVEFPEALKILAQKAGVTLQHFESAVAVDVKEKLFEICEKSAKFFEKQLWGGIGGGRALAYLRERGLADGAIKDFRLGFAPDNWRALTGYLRESGYQDGEIVSAGMAIRRQSAISNQQSAIGSGIYDRFRSRIMFPVLNIGGQVVGFTGRIFETQNSKLKTQSPEAEPAKYINTPQTMIYDKSRILYGLDKARTEIRRAGQCVLVEGNMDVIMSHQAGVKNAVATSGTALTQEHLRLLGRYAPNVGFCFDDDRAGALATRRGIGLALAKNFNVKIIDIDDKDCKDPADYVKKRGQDWSQLVAAARPALDFYFEKVKKNFNSASPEDKKNAIASLAPFIKRLVSQVEKSHWLSRLSFLLRTKEEAVAADIAAAKDDLEVYEAAISEGAENSTGPAAKQADTPIVADILTETLISIILNRPALFKDKLKNSEINFLNSEAAEILGKLAKMDLTSFKFGEFVKDFNQDSALKLEFANLKAQETWRDFKEEELLEEFANVVNKLKRKKISADLLSLEFEMKEAESLKNRERINVLTAKFSKLAKELADK